jgi:hypothetical protein
LLNSQVLKACAYRLCDLRIVSDFSLDGLQACRDDSAALHEIVIRRAHIPEGLASVTATFRNGQYIGTYNGRELLIDIPAAARFIVRDGKEILIDPAPFSDAGEVRAYLLGMALGLLCHQRGGITPLHASAVDVADGCVAFVGDSGDGKSTLAAALAQRGYSPICDDVCFMHLGTNENLRAWPGISRIRLWEDSRAALGYKGPGVEKEIHGYSKYFVPVTPPQNPAESRRLRRVYELHPGPSSAPELTRLRGGAAIEALMQNIYGIRGAEHMGYKPRAFIVCAAAARNTEVFRFNRPLGFDALSHGIDCLEKHLRDVP